MLGVLGLAGCAVGDSDGLMAQDGSNGFVIANAHASLQVCPFDLSQRPLHVFYVDPSGQSFKTIAAVNQSLKKVNEHLLCASNGALFEVGEKPLGWLVVQGVTLHPVNSRVSGSGNFYLQPNGALVIDDAGIRIIATDKIGETSAQVSHIALAEQSGPILIQDGVINPRFLPESTSRYTRNAVCLTDARHGFLLYAAKPVSFFEFSQSLSDFGCRDALYLDGHLSQMWPFTEPLDVVQRQPLATIVGVTQKDP